MGHNIRIDRAKIHPLLNYKLGRLLKKCTNQGIDLIITEGYRTVADQDALYAKGRTAPGSVVTNAKGSNYSSQHQWGIAFDVAINDKTKTYDVALLNKVGAIAKSIGLGWGGEWTGFIDRPHFYLKKWGSGVGKIKAKYSNFDKYKSTWTARVCKPSGLNMFADTDKKEVITKLKDGQVVAVLYKKRWYARIRCDGQYGYVRKKYIK